ncbi:hypothetical protein D3C84_1263530 [compost metagenome]
MKLWIPGELLRKLLTVMDLPCRFDHKQPLSAVREWNFHDKLALVVETEAIPVRSTCELPERAGE